MRRLMRRLRTRRTDDEGTTLLELMVGMVVMSIFMALATAAIVNIFSSTSKIQAVASSAGQLNIAFDRLDKQVRYASVIFAPTGPASTPATDWSVAFETDNPASIGCTLLKVRALGDGSGQQQLVERTWTVTVNSDGTSTQSAVSTWSQLSAGISLTDQNGTGVTPFAVSTPSGGTVQQLRLRLVDLNGTNQSSTKSFTEISFSARNSGNASATYPNGSTGSTCSPPAAP